MGRGAIRASLLVSLVASLCACNHDPLFYTPEGDGGTVDLASTPDLATSACRTHQILFTPLDDIQVVGPKAGRVGSSLLVRIAYTLRQGCDVPGDVDVRVMPGNATDFVVITMRTWRGDKECGAPITAWRTISLGPDQFITNFNLLISDGAPGGTRMLRLGLARPPAVDCGVSHVEGEACDGDCQCNRVDPTSRCVMAPGAVDFRCRTPCSSDVDCGAWQMGPGSCGGGTGQVCGTCSAGLACDCNITGCPLGKVCSGLRCVPRPAVAGGSCSCDSDCGEGRICDQGHNCLSPCTTKADCGAPAAICEGGRCK